MSASSSPSMTRSSRLLGQYLRPLWASVTLMVVLILAGIALQLGLPLVMRSFIDAVQGGQAMPVLLRLGAVYLLAALVQQVISVGATYVSENVGWNATNALRTDLAAHCLRLDLSFHNAHSPGELIERIDGDVAALSNFFSRFMVSVVGNLLLLLGVLVLLFAVDWRVGGAIALFTGSTLYLMLRFRNLAVPYWKAERQASAELYSFLEERLAGAEDVRANGGKSYVMNRFYSAMRELLRRSLKAAMMINIMLNTSLFMFALGIAAAFSTGAYLYQQQIITLGTVYLIFQYTVMLQRPLEEISRQMQDLQKALAGVARVNELFSERSRLDRAPAHAALPAEVGHAAPAARAAELEGLPPTGSAFAVQFERVSFAYPDAPPPAAAPEADPATSGDPEQAGPADHPAAAPPRLEAEQRHPAGEIVLHELSFRLEAGQVLGLLGRTGSGKTSLTRLLFRLYDPSTGAIRIQWPPAASPGLPTSGAAVDLRSLPLQALRRRIGMIPQNVQLFNASVRDNLTFFDPGIPDQAVLQALRELGLWAWFQALPAGLDSLLESGGSGLSAGQAQLLAFARIFLRDPGLIILDEASSRLDPATEQWIESAIDRLVHGRTAVIVAHRLDTVQRASHILVLEQGRILEYGPRPALAADPQSHFHKLLETGLEELLA